MRAQAGGASTANKVGPVLTATWLGD